MTAKVRFDEAPSTFPKSEKGNKRLFFEYMLLRRSYEKKLKDPKAGLDASLEEHVKYYILILEEMKRRGLELPKPTGHPIERDAHRFSSLVPIKKSKANAVYLESHAKEVYDGSKVLWVTKRPYRNMLNKYLYLAGDNYVWGQVKLLSIDEITAKEFDELRPLHKVTKEEQERWWPGTDKFYAYAFRFVKFKKPRRFLGLPKGPQVFFTLTPKLMKAEKSIHFEFIGTKGFVEFPPKLTGGRQCTADWCVDPVNLRRKHSGLVIDKLVQIDGCGWDWRNSAPKVKAVILTHLHPDHAGALWQGEDSKLAKHLVKNKIPIHVWKGSLKIKRGSMAKPLRDKLRVLIHQPGGGFTVEGHQYRFFPVKHSTVAPAAAVLIDDRLLYAPDFLGFKAINPLKDRELDLFIGDASSMKVDLRRPNTVGHMSMFNQTKLAAKWGVKRVKFTHVGHLHMTHKEAKETLRVFAQDSKLYEDPHDVYIAEDKDYGELKADGSILWRGKHLHKVKKEFYKPNKPFWREFENEGVLKIKGFKFPAKVVIKIDGMRQQLNTKVNTIRSEDEGFHKEHMFKKIVKEFDKLPEDTVLDAEGVMVDKKGKPLHRTSFIGYANSKKYDPEKEARCQFWVFDIYRYKGREVLHKPFLERLEILHKIKDTEHVKVLKPGKDYFIVENPKQLLKRLEQVRKVPGSEGAMVIWDQGLETTTNQNRAWVKLKNLNEVDVLVTDRTHPKHKDTGKEIKSVWNYMVAAGPYEGKCAKIARQLAPKHKIIERDGKVYAYLGRTFNTKITAPVGGIIRIASPEINKYEIKDKEGKPTGCFHYGVFQPRVLEYVHEKHRPDNLQVLDRLAAQVAPRTVKKAVSLDEKTYKEIRREGEPLPPKFYKWAGSSKTYRGVLHRHYPTGKLVEIEKSRGLFVPLVAKSFWREADGLCVELVGEQVKKFFKRDRLIVKFRDHVDWRVEKNSELIGVTIHPPTPAGKNAWDVFLERARQGEKSQVTAKYPHPKSWLKYEGELLFPTIHGGRRLSVAKIEIKERFKAKFGVQRKNLHEWFVKGKKLNGRFVLRVILSPSTGKPIWILVRPKDNQWPLNPTEHKDEGYVDIIRNEKLSREMARSPRA